MSENQPTKEQFLASYDREHATTMRVLRAYPKDKIDLRPHPKAKTARELAWVFVVERALGTFAWNNEIAKALSAGSPKPPEDWEALLAAVEKGHQDFRSLVSGAPDSMFTQKVQFFTAPKTMGEISRIDLLWFLLSDEIHHRGQFSVYLRMADGKVPSIYGPSADEPWM